ncbi:MAG: hypothetical protein ACTSRU_12385 [Candidatus Hodarchaeales archaeon]
MKICNDSWNAMIEQRDKEKESITEKMSGIILGLLFGLITIGVILVVIAQEDVILLIGILFISIAFIQFTIISVFILFREIYLMRADIISLGSEIRQHFVQKLKDKSRAKNYLIYSIASLIAAIGFVTINSTFTDQLPGNLSPILENMTNLALISTLLLLLNFSLVLIERSNLYQLTKPNLDIPTDTPRKELIKLFDEKMNQFVIKDDTEYNMRVRTMDADLKRIPQVFIAPVIIFFILHLVIQPLTFILLFEITILFFILFIVLKGTEEDYIEEMKELQRLVKVFHHNATSTGFKIRVEKEKSTVPREMTVLKSSRETEEQRGIGQFIDLAKIMICLFRGNKTKVLDLVYIITMGSILVCVIMETNNGMTGMMMGVVIVITWLLTGKIIYSALKEERYLTRAKLVLGFYVAILDKRNVYVSEAGLDD